MNVVGEAANGAEALEKCAALRPDILLMDINMPGFSSFDAARQIKKARPEIKVIFLSMFDDGHYLTQAL